MLKIFALRCEYKNNPIGIDVHKPRFFWKLSSGDRSAMQSAYQINVAASEQDLKSGSSLIWDSGMVKDDRSIHVEYAGPALKSRKRLFWRVRVWDEKGIESEWSETSFWEMGLQNAHDWKAKLIQPDLNFALYKIPPRWF